MLTFLLTFLLFFCSALKPRWQRDAEVGYTLLMSGEKEVSLRLFRTAIHHLKNFVYLSRALEPSCKKRKKKKKSIRQR